MDELLYRLSVVKETIESDVTATLRSISDDVNVDEIYSHIRAAVELIDSKIYEIRRLQE